MCGIAGIIPLQGGKPPSIEQLGAMCETIVHRGPNEEGLDIRDHVALGVRRLSIIDITGGHQPMFSEDRSVRAVFNGEIYNFRELRRELEAAGHRFATSSDGEVIVHLWEEHGVEFASRLNGMFAIAVHDMKRRVVALIRDRIGIKPLYYAITPDHLVFGSEVKVLLASGLVPRELDLDGVGQFMCWEYVPAPKTLLKGVRKLQPATIRVVDLAAGTTREALWWDLPITPSGDGPVRGRARMADEWEEQIDQKIGQCVRRQLVSDVPLGAFLSGGVDSSLVVGSMGDARTFSIGFDDPSYNEVSWASKAARHLGVSHRVEILKPRVDELFQHLMHFMDDPIGDFSIFPTYLVSQLAREEVTVVLSGDGGDELFAGYEAYVAQEKARTWQRIPWVLRRGLLEPWLQRLKPRPSKKGFVNKAKRFMEGMQHDECLGHARWRLFVGDALRRQLFTPEALACLATPVEEHILRLLKDAGQRCELDRELYVDVKSYLVDNCLVKVDRMSMACSLEARVPLLDHELVELAFRVPANLKLNRNQTKILLKKVAARHVPRECVYRPKEGFSIPIKHWICDELRPLMEELLDTRRLVSQGIFRAETVDRLKTEHLGGRANHSHILWTLMVFQDWTQRWAVS